MDMTKPMIDLIREIRRRSPDDVKNSIKFANPDVIDELIDIYQESTDPIFIALVKELCVLAGPPWSLSLNGEQESPAEEPQKFKTKVYRGQTTLEPISNKSDDEKKPAKPVRMYRGHPIK